ncbi:MAG: DMT family transporter [Alphaproteobacteria bacterium]|nr:DMT family transporter [Alphaproteobacteria bacterium]
MAIPLWIIYSVSAAILWGLGYVLSEKLMKETAISPAFLMMAIELITLPMCVLLCLHLGQFKSGLSAVFSSPQVMILLLLAALTVIGGNFLILNSVVEKNATLTTLIEISYPFFTILFAYLILKETQVDWWTALGGLLIFSGVIVIILKN